MSADPISLGKFGRPIQSYDEWRADNPPVPERRIDRILIDDPRRDEGSKPARKKNAQRMD